MNPNVQRIKREWNLFLEEEGHILKANRDFFYHPFDLRKPEDPGVEKLTKELKNLSLEEKFNPAPGFVNEKENIRYL